jgi:CMP-N-acetylneuraminic acid synthetase
MALEPTPDIPQTDMNAVTLSFENAYAFIPAKGHSSRIPEKNRQTVGGIPLFLRAALHLASVMPRDRIIVDSDSDAILEEAQKNGFGTMKRPPELATNATDGNAFFRWETSHYPQAGIYIQHLPPMPFLVPATLQKALHLVQSGEADSIIPVGRARHYTWDAISGKPNYNLGNLPNSFDLPETVFETMGLYLIRAEAHRATGGRIGLRPVFLELSRIEQIDIDYPEDLEMARAIAEGLPPESPYRIQKTGKP